MAEATARPGADRVVAAGRIMRKTKWRANMKSSIEGLEEAINDLRAEIRTEIRCGESKIYRYIHRNDKWRYLVMDIGTYPEREVPIVGGEYRVLVKCPHCNNTSSVCLRHGVSLSEIGNIECQYCKIEFAPEAYGRGAYTE